MTGKKALNTLLRELRIEFPRFRIIRMRDSRIMRAIDLLLRVLTLGYFTRFLASYAFALGQTVYVPGVYDKLGPNGQMLILTHVRVHMREMGRYTVMGGLFLRMIRWAREKIT